MALPLNPDEFFPFLCICFPTNLPLDFNYSRIWSSIKDLGVESLISRMVTEEVDRVASETFSTAGIEKLIEDKLTEKFMA